MRVLRGLLIAAAGLLALLHCGNEQAPAAPWKPTLLLGVGEQCAGNVERVTLTLFPPGGEPQVLREIDVEQLGDLPASVSQALPGAPGEICKFVAEFTTREPASTTPLTLLLPVGTLGRITLSLPCPCVGFACQQGETCAVRAGVPSCEQVEQCEGDSCSPLLVCGDGVCQATEGASSCSVDCQQGCGDGACGDDESCDSCPQDCACPGAGAGQSGAAGNAGKAGGAGAAGQGGAGAAGQGGAGQGGAGSGGKGGAGQAGQGGAGQAGVGGAGMSGGSGQSGASGSGPACGDGKCEGGEGCSSCPQDCGKCCGDGKCEGGETCATCAADCGSCCGNGACDGGESCEGCPQDCGACPAVCGDGKCAGGEICATCVKDCGDGCYTVPVSRSYKNGAGHWMSSGPPPAGFAVEVTWKIRAADEGESIPWYQCVVGDHATLGTDPGCGGLGAGTFLGWADAKPDNGGQKLYRCTIAGGADHFIVSDPGCEGAPQATLDPIVLGYAR